SAFAFVTEDNPPNKKEIKKHFDAFEVGDLDYKAEAAPVSSHIWLVSSGGKNVHRLTSGPWSISTVNAGGGTQISWSADGKTIAITKLPNAVFGDIDPATTALVDAKSGKVAELPRQRRYMTQQLFAPVGCD